MKTLLLAVSLLLVPLAFTQTLSRDQGVTIRPRTALQGFNPMNPSAVGHPVITSTGPSGDALLKQFTVTNYSAKAVTFIEYGWRISAPAACSSSTQTLPVKWDTATVNVNIASGAEAHITTAESLGRTGAAPDLVAQARATNTPVVQVTIGIVQATFADGSTWTDNDALERNTFDNNLHDKKEGCQLSTVSEMQKKKRS